MAQNTKQKHTNAQITKHNWWPFHLDSKQSHTAHVWKAAECLFSNHIVVLLLAQIGAFFILCCYALIHTHKSEHLVQNMLMCTNVLLWSYKLWDCTMHIKSCNLVTKSIATKSLRSLLFGQRRRMRWRRWIRFTAKPWNSSGCITSKISSFFVASMFLEVKDKLNTRNDCINQKHFPVLRPVLTTSRWMESCHFYGHGFEQMRIFKSVSRDKAESDTETFSWNQEGWMTLGCKIITAWTGHSVRGK